MTTKIQLRRVIDGGMEDVNPITSEECVMLEDGKKLKEVVDFVATTEDFEDEDFIVEENLVDRVESIENRIDSEFEQQNSQIATGLSNIKTVEQNISNKVDTEVAKVNAQLSNKANYNEVIKKGQVSLNDCDSELLSAIQNGDGTSFNLLSIPRDYSVNYKKTDFLKPNKNLLDMSKAINGYYVNYGTGKLVSNEDNKVVEYIPLDPNTTYTLSSQSSKDLSQMAFYDAEKKYVSGLPNSGLQESVTFTTEGDVHFMSLTIPVTVNDGVQLEKGSSMTDFEKFSYEIDNLKVNNSNIENGNNLVYKEIGKNKFNMLNCTYGYYVNYGTGRLTANADNKASDFIKLKPNTTYTLSSQSNGDLSQMAFYDSAKIYKNGLTNSGIQKSITFTTDDDTHFLRLSIPITVDSGIQLEEGNEMTDFEEYGVYIKESDLPKSLFKNNMVNRISVRTDGMGDYTNLRNAIESIEDASENNKYIINISEGVYDVFSDFTETELNDTSFIGIVIPNHVSIKGDGDRNKIILNGILPPNTDSVTLEAHQRISTLCLFGNVDLENITVIGENMRYAVHDDYNYQNSVKNIKNCVFIKKIGNGTNYGGKQAWGEGSWSGQEYYFEDCDFITEFNYYAYTSHNNYNFTRPSYHKFVNCSFLTTTGESIRFESLGSGQVERVDMIGCRMNGNIALTCYSENAENIIDHRLYGYGNDVVPVRIEGKDKEYSYEFVGQTRKYFNATGSVITKGTPVMLNSGNTSIVKLTGNETIRFLGVALEDIEKTGMVQVGGYLPVNKTNLTGLVVGDKIGIINGELAKVTTGDYVGVVILNDYIKLVV